jgi:hypothetical protein
MKGLNIDEAAWMKEASGSVPKLLEPLALTAAKMWLIKRSYQDDAYLDKSEFQVWFIKGYRGLDEKGHISEELSNWISARDLGFWDFSAAEIEDLAEWAGLEKTTHWYTGVGWIAWEASELQRAGELLEKAIEMVSLSPTLTTRRFWTKSFPSTDLRVIGRIPLHGSPWKPKHGVSEKTKTTRAPSHGLKEPSIQYQPLLSIWGSTHFSWPINQPGRRGWETILPHSN